jgi:hypothetical protein
MLHSQAARTNLLKYLAAICFGPPYGYGYGYCSREKRQSISITIMANLAWTNAVQNILISGISYIQILEEGVFLAQNGEVGKDSKQCSNKMIG